MRPHSLTTPKPLIPIAGKPMVQRIVEDILSTCNEPIGTIAFVCGRFGEAAEKHLVEVAESLGAKGKIYYQDTPLGTAHAILCAAEELEGPVFVAFADTLFDADFKLDTSKDAIIWTQKVADPSAFGVVKLDEKGVIIEFVEKPKDFVSDLAIIGVYYFKDGQNLKNELQYLIDNNITNGGEFQLTTAMENMKNKGIQFFCDQVKEWLDCGNAKAVLYTNERILALKASKENAVATSAEVNNSLIIAPCFIGENVIIDNSIIGPNVSLEAGVIIKNSIVKDSIIRDNAQINDAILKQSLIGSSSHYQGQAQELSLGDFSTIA